MNQIEHGARGGVWPVAVAAGLMLAAVGLGVTYRATRHPVAIQVDGVRFEHRTHQRSAGAVLAEAGIILSAYDTYEAPNAEALLRGAPIVVHLARPVSIEHDGALTTAWVRADDVRGALVEAGVALLPHDRVSLEGGPCTLNDPLPSPTRTGRSALAAWVAAWRQPIALALRRSVPITIYEGEIPLTLYTSAKAVGEALYAEGIVVYEGDRIYPALDTAIAPELTIRLTRARPMTLEADGRARLVRTHATDVAGLLGEQGIRLGPKDYTQPEPTAALVRDGRVMVVRVYDEYYVEETPIAFATRWEPDPNLEIDLREIADWGREGALRRRVRVHYENGQELHRTEEAEWVAREPADRIYRFGTKIVLRQMDTPSGAVTYWRKVRMLATSYSASTAGTALDAPYYGRTRLGLPARKGIVAVDPSVVSLGQQVYVPGYGVALAGDTGGGIKGRRVDLCYDDDSLINWYRWVDVYLLAPAPQASAINWSLPNTPKERD